MSIEVMSTKTIGEKLRHIREEKELPLRKVAALLDIDVAILSKILYEIQDEELGIEALKVAEERAKYIKGNKKK